MVWDERIAGAFSLEGRVAVITGAASGLGREAAHVLSSAGARVVLADINQAGLEETAALAQRGAPPVVCPTDISQPSEIEALAAAALDCGRLDIWVNSAGITAWEDVVSASPEATARVVAINMMGTFWSCSVAGRVMVAQGRGSIVNISSTAGDSPVPQLSVYGMTKAAVNQLTRVCALEFGQAGVRVNAVVPGWIDTPINESMYRDPGGAVVPEMREQVLEDMAAISPLGLTGVPLDIGLAVLYLASDASRFVTGQMLRVSGGI
jgi:3-oxoacyl-[acyl-carrier protein] reductase